MVHLADRAGVRSDALLSCLAPAVVDEQYDGELHVTIIATGFAPTYENELLNGGGSQVGWGTVWVRSPWTGLVRTQGCRVPVQGGALVHSGMACGPQQPRQCSILPSADLPILHACRPASSAAPPTRLPRLP